MGLLIQFESDDWRSCGAVHAADPEAWNAANPAVVELGPFDTVEVTRNGVVGRVEGQERALAQRNRDGVWTPVGLQRLYDRFRIVGGSVIAGAPLAGL